MNFKHGGARTPLYRVWLAMRHRCNSPADPAFANYGGRGIKVCDRWQRFDHFLEDMGLPPAGMTLERQRNNEGYGPENCFWATRIEQGRNKRNNVLITARGESLTASEWSERTGIKTGTIFTRAVVLGWDHEDAISRPVNLNAPRRRHPASKYHRSAA
jgi:hypothetical protein